MADRPESLAAALAELQQHLPRIGKDETGRVQGVTKAGKPFSYDYKYAGLTAVNEALLPLLGERGFAFTCGPTMLDGQFVLEWVLWHAPSGEKIEGFYPLPSSSPQTMGGAITYARRYCLLAVTGAAPDEDDDDAQAAEQAAREQRRLPPETDEHGAATQAELTRMDRGHEPGTWRATSTAENDPYYDQPPAPPEDEPASIAKRQLSMMHAKFTALGISDREKRLRWTEVVIGRPIESSADLTYREAETLLEALTQEARDRSTA